MALAARLREAEAQRANADAEVAALHDQAAARAAESERCVVLACAAEDILILIILESCLKRTQQKRP